MVYTTNIDVANNSFLEIFNRDDLKTEDVHNIRERILDIDVENLLVCLKKSGVNWQVTKVIRKKKTYHYPLCLSICKGASIVHIVLSYKEKNVIARVLDNKYIQVDVDYYGISEDLFGIYTREAC